jgi:phosphoribosylformylglycinamidine (FGAM) synthase PurS component
MEAIKVLQGTDKVIGVTFKNSNVNDFDNIIVHVVYTTGETVEGLKFSLKALTGHTTGLIEVASATRVTFKLSNTYTKAMNENLYKIEMKVLVNGVIKWADFISLLSIEKSSTKLL